MAAGLSVPAAQADRMVPVVAPTAATARVADGGNRRQRLVHRGEHRHLPSPCNHVCGQLLHRQLHVLLLQQLLLLKRLMLLLPPLLRRMVEACMLRFGVRPSRSRASTLRWNGSHHALRPPLLAGGGPERRRDSRRVGHVQSLPAPSSAPAAARRLPLVCDAFEILREMYA